MIIYLGKNALWTGKKLDRCKIVTFEEGVKMIMEAGGYTWEQVEERFDKVSDSAYLGGMGMHDFLPKTKESFLNSAKAFLKACDSPDKWETDKMSLLEPRGENAEWKNTAAGIARTLYSHCACK